MLAAEYWQVQLGRAAFAALAESAFRILIFLPGVVVLVLGGASVYCNNVRGLQAQAGANNG